MLSIYDLVYQQHEKKKKKERKDDKLTRLQHYDFLFFIMNKTLGPSGTVLFNYDAEGSKPPKPPSADNGSAPATTCPLSSTDNQAPSDSIEGASDDPTLTRVVDRRWYERNKHIYPASMWQDFDPERDYQKEVRRDPGGNTFFYS